MSYECPINAIYGEITHKILKDAEENLMLEVQQAIGYDIDKDELIRALRYDRNQYEKGFEDGKPKWIPCSDRMPGNNGWYLCTIRNEIETKVVEVRFYEDTQWKAYGWRVTAWMPLPEPYKEVEDE